MKTSIVALNKTGGNAVATVVAALKQLHPTGEMCFGVATPTKFVTAEAPDTLGSSVPDSSVALAYAASTALPRDEPQVIRLEGSTALFDGIVYAPPEQSTPLEAFVQKLRGNCERVAEAFVKEVEADFSLVIAEQGKLTAARDPVGVQSLYYGETDSTAAFASNRKTLWQLGMSEPKSFPPGNVATVTREGFRFKPVKTLANPEPKPIEIEEAARALEKLLEDSVRKRVFGLRKVAVAFSGGVDSSVVAYLAKRCCVEVQLVHVSLEGQPETEVACRAAEELGLPLQVHLFKESDVEKAVVDVVALVEESDPVKASIGIPFFWAAQKTAEAGLKVLLAGQGADELFGGYQRYVTEYIAQGGEAVRKTMYRDVTCVHESNLERDEKICMHHDVELRLPFASFELAEFALSLPTELKFEKKPDSLRKLVLRKAAENMGLCAAISAKPKKAVQYSTGISGALKKLAKKHDLTLAEYIKRFYEESKHGAQ